MKILVVSGFHPEHEIQIVLNLIPNILNTKLTFLCIKKIYSK